MCGVLVQYSDFLQSNSGTAQQAVQDDNRNVLMYS